MAYAATAKRYKEEARLAALKALEGHEPPMWVSAFVTATFHFKTRRGRDQDNLIASLKHGIDGICAAGVMENDKGLHWLEPVERIDKSEYVILEIEEDRK